MVSRRREQNDVLRDFMTALALCNNVTPVEQAAVADFDNDDQGELNIRDLRKQGSAVGSFNRGSLTGNAGADDEPQP